MKKFHGKRVPNPMMKKMIHTALYLGKRKKESSHEGHKLTQFPPPPPPTGSHPNLILHILKQKQSFSHLSRGALMAVMVLVRLLRGTCSVSG